MFLSVKLKRALNVEPPCELIFEYNEKKEIVVRPNNGVD